MSNYRCMKANCTLRNAFSIFKNSSLDSSHGGDSGCYWTMEYFLSRALTLIGIALGKFESPVSYSLRNGWDTLTSSTGLNYFVVCHKFKLPQEGSGFDNYHKVAVLDHVSLPKFWRTWRTWVYIMHSYMHISGVIPFT